MLGPEFQVVCVCGGYGYPLGNASAARITMVGRALQAGGFGFSLLHCGPSPMTINTEPSGVYEGIPFEYTTPVRRPENPLARVLMYIRGALVLTLRLAQLRPVRRSSLVYLYVMDGPLSLYVGMLCALLGLPVVQELCEWFPGVPGCSRFTKWFYNKPIFKLATGVLVISKFIERCVLSRQAAVNPRLSIHRLPAVVDADRFSGPEIVSNSELVPAFVYCGTWLIDINFLIDAFALVRNKGYSCKLKLVGGSLEEYGKTILDLAAAQGLSSDDIIFTGCVDDRTLQACYRNAVALLMPLWTDDRSIARIPNKMPEYLASGRPVVAGNSGDLTEILADGVNAYLPEAGNTVEFANRMMAILDDPDRASRIGAAGRDSCVAHLDYRAHVEGLARFFGSCFHQRSGQRPFSLYAGAATRISRVVRNTGCELIALALILMGRVRKARHTALTENVISAIYFHKPDKLLFGRCIDWLIRYGYVFVSADDVNDWLYRGKVPPRGAVWISFDDGCRELLTNVLPVVRERNIPITLFIPSGIVANEGLYPWMDGKRNCARDSITLDQLKELATYPQVTIAGHTVTHAITAGLAED